MIKKIFKRLFLYSAGLTFTNMARLFMRLFTGIMFMQFGIRQITSFNELATTFPSVLGMGSETTLVVMILIEIVCSIFILLGLLTRWALVPPLVSMIIAENFIMQYYSAMDMSRLYSMQAGYVPVMFIGIFVFMMLAGPGKISLDYIISVHLASVDEEVEAEAAEVELEDS